MNLKGILFIVVGVAMGSCDKAADLEGARGVVNGGADPVGETSKRTGEDGAAKEREIEITPGVKLVLVWCPPGGVQRQKLNLFNEPEGGTEDVFRLTKGYWIGKYEVTQEQWAAVMGTNPSKFKGRSYPVERVRWEDARAFLEKAGKGLRLPTAAEWEWACRAGSQTAYCFGDDQEELADYAWFGGIGSGSHPVGEKMANAWEIYDMHGNVWEWCQDFDGEDYWGATKDMVDAGIHYEYKGSRIDPVGPKDGTRHVSHGGSWGDIGYHCRSAVRGWDRSDQPELLGFRVAMSSTE